jgi:hypothetical protein
LCRISKKEQSIEELPEKDEVFFQREFEGLAELQLNLLKAIVNGVDKEFAMGEVTKKPTCLTLNETARQYAKNHIITHCISSHACLMFWRQSKPPYRRVAMLR